MTAVNYPIAVANLNITEDHPLWRTHALQRSVVFNVKGFKIGVIGYILPETKNKTRVDDVEFSPEIEAIKFVYLHVLFQLKFELSNYFVFYKFNS